MAITHNFDTAILALINGLVPADTVDISQAVYTSAFEVGDIAEGHQIITGVRTGQVIPILSKAPKYDSFPYKDPTNCVIPSCDLDLGFGAKTWELGMIACKIPICINTFDENFLLFWNQYKRVFGDADLSGALMTYITDIFQNNLNAAIWRQVWFGDTAATTNIYLKGNDGIFTQAEAMDGVKIPIAENGAGTGLTGQALYDYFNEAYQIASVSPWWNPSTAQIEMTQAMASVLVAWLNSMGDRTGINCECFSPDGITAQRTFSIDANLRIFGVPIHVHREFDGIISTFALGNPYRAILTSSTNILIGTSELDQLPAFDVWYSKDDDQIYIKGGANVGASLVTNEYVYLGAETASPSV